jgi:hypothetical protein
MENIMSKLTQKTTNATFKNIIEHVGMYFYLPNVEQDRDSGQMVEVNDLRFAQEAVLRSVANALFYQLKSSQNYYERAVQIGRDMLNSTRPGPNMEDRFAEQRERILRAQAQVETVRTAFKDSVRAYEHFTAKNWAEPNYTPRTTPQSAAAADLAALIGGDAGGRGDDLAVTSGDTRNRVA